MRELSSSMTASNGWPLPPPGARLPSLLDLPASEWGEALTSWVDVPYRIDQLANWVFRHGIFDFAAMGNVPISLRQQLAERCSIAPAPIESRFTSADRTRRYLLRLPDGRRIEAVYMPYRRRATLCISSQAGCRFACGFCQTGTMGLHRSLTAGEIVGQVVRLRWDQESLQRPVNVVFMGQGEPLDNARAVLRAVEALQDPLGPDLSWRRITLSTVGVVPELRRLAGLGRKRPRLAISLNATTDALRSRLMPINRKWPISELLDAVNCIVWRGREQVTFEYVLLAGINDTSEDARRLGSLLSTLPAKVNLIPWNRVAGMPYLRPSPQAVESFRQQVRRTGLDVLVRYSRGADIAAACGQLAAGATG
ncbi:MAG: 23S rRNA (adenine(2503)-C(2))-methyltransferase RlmN [Acidobacteriota bacterium]